MRVRLLDGSGAYRFAGPMKRRRAAKQLPSIKALVRSARKAAAQLPWKRSARIRYERELVEQSALFDADWYLGAYPDVAQAGIDPVEHFMTIGWRESRNPGPLFTTSRYLRANEDVAASGVNPLLHFIEFGISEGRDGFGDGSTMPLATVESFVPLGQASDCISFPGSRTPRLQWLRHDALDVDDDRLVKIDNIPIGYASEPAARAAIQAAVDQLRLLSGAPASEAKSGVASLFRGGHRLADAWYANAHQLRTRWTTGSTPAVLRIFQCDPWNTDTARLIGEGGIASAVDFVDAYLRSPYLPLLCVFTTPEGELAGHYLIPFPSLCRGGLHYPELLWTAEADQLHLNEINSELAGRLLARRTGQVTAAISRIEIKPSQGEDGPFFQPDFRLWVEQLFDVEIRVASSENLKKVATTPDGATLVMPADGAPTIAALLEPEFRPTGDQDQTVPILVSTPNPSGPILYADARVYAGLLETSDGFPSVRGDNRPDFPPAAIRPSRRDSLAEAELLVPWSRTFADEPQERLPITWLIDVTAGRSDLVLQTVHTLGLQHSARSDAIALIGTPGNGTADAVRRVFPGQVELFTNRRAAVAALSTELAGSVVPGVLLHDRDTAGQFAAMLESDAVATASCVLISASRHGGMLQAAIVDAGAMAAKDGRAAPPRQAAWAAAELWRGTYPVSAPSRQLWAARTAALQAQSAGVHLCSSKVTAIAAPDTSPAPAEDMPPANETAIKIDWLVE